MFIQNARKDINLITLIVLEIEPQNTFKDVDRTLNHIFQTIVCRWTTTDIAILLYTKYHPRQVTWEKNFDRVNGINFDKVFFMQIFRQKRWPSY